MKKASIEHLRIYTAFLIKISFIMLDSVLDDTKLREYYTIRFAAVFRQCFCDKPLDIFLTSTFKRAFKLSFSPSTKMLG